MRISTLVPIALGTLFLVTGCANRDTPIRDAIKSEREARRSDGSKSLPRAVQTITLKHGGLDRVVLIQSTGASSVPKPVVIALHGGTRGASDIFDRTTWPAIATREGFLLAAPQGLDNQWNDGRDTTISGTRSEADDVGFLVSLIDTLVRDHGADRDAVFVTGISNGGLMSLRLGCERSGSVKAIAPVIATLPEVLAGTCAGAAPLPALFVAGTADPLMTYNGEPGPLAKRRGPSAPMLSIPETLDLWRIRNDCDDKGGARDLPDTNKSDQSTVTVITYSPCRSGAPVVHYRINGGGHQMPSLEPQKLSPQVAALVGPQNTDIEGAEEIWRFFKSQ
jgi:polyhydroxybutyrate depolymerase